MDDESVVQASAGDDAPTPAARPALSACDPARVKRLYGRSLVLGVIGGVMLVWASLLIVVLVTTAGSAADGPGDPPVWALPVMITVQVVTAVAFLLRPAWGWPAGMLASLALIGGGVFAVMTISGAGLIGVLVGGLMLSACGLGRDLFGVDRYRHADLAAVNKAPRSPSRARRSRS